MPIERDHAIPIIQTILAYMKVVPEPSIQEVMQTYSAFVERLKEHKESARKVMDR